MKAKPMKNMPMKDDGKKKKGVLIVIDIKKAKPGKKDTSKKK